MQIILSTRNPSKAEQIRQIFVGSPIHLLTLADTTIEGEAIENGESLEENSLKKAVFAHERVGGVTIADDTGLFIRHLGGAPGIRSARWAGETATTDEITAHTLRMLEGAVDRTAVFRTVVAVVLPNGLHYFFDGEAWGKILEAPRCKPQPKMPYSPIFAADEGNGLVWAEMDLAFENSISHRGKAFRKAKAFLESLGA